MSPAPPSTQLSQRWRWNSDTLVGQTCALAGDNRHFLWTTIVFQSEGHKTRGTLLFSSQIHKCLSLFAQCLKNETQVLCFIIENKILHIIPELGMLSSRTMFLDVTQLTYTAILSREYWKDITKSWFSSLTLSVKWFVSGCLRTQITVATGISTAQRQGKRKVSVPKSLQSKFSIQLLEGTLQNWGRHAILLH